MPFRGGPSPAAYHLKSLVGYNNHQENSLKPRLPQWSMGVRLQDRQNTSGPGPAQYDSKMISKNRKIDPPEFSFGRRLEYKSNNQSPGPAKYEISDMNKIKKRSYTYAMGARIIERSFASGPPPNAYKYNIDIIKPQAPTFQMLERHDDKMISRSPGPAVYNSGLSKIKTLRDPPSYSMQSSIAIYHQQHTPAPNQYKLYDDPTARGPTYIFGEKHNEFSNTLSVPEDNCVDY